MAYILTPSPWQQFIDANGIPYAGGKLYTYEAGTTSPSAVFRDNLGTPQTNPIILDASGSCTIFLPSNAVAYKFVLHDVNDVPVATQDNVTVAFPEGAPPIPNLNADLLDGLDSTAFLQVPLAGSAVIPNLNADKLDGLDSTDFVRTTGLGPQPWPVGSVFIAVVPTDPYVLLGYGTWVAFGTGRVLVGIDPVDPLWYYPEQVGGVSQHVLSPAEMPYHTHAQDAHNHAQVAHNHAQDAHAHGQDAHGHGISDPGHQHPINDNSSGTGGVGAEMWAGPVGNGIAAGAIARPSATGVAVVANTINIHAATATNQATLAVNQAAVATNQPTGGNAPHTNTQPYIAVYFWKRTA